MGNGAASTSRSGASAGAQSFQLRLIANEKSCSRTKLMVESNRRIPRVVVFLDQTDSGWYQAPIGCVANRRRTLPPRTQRSLYCRLHLSRLRPEQNSAPSSHQMVVTKLQCGSIHLVTQCAIHSPRNIV